VVARAKGTARAVDHFQRGHRPLALAFAVVKKFGDDRAGNLAALVAYYAFFSLFPLLLVLVTVTGFVLSGNPELQGKLVDSALQQFPVVGDELRTSIGAFNGSGIALAVGIVGALWGGLGAIDALQNAMNSVWNVPIRKRPNMLQSRLRGVAMLVVLGAAIAATTALGSVAGAADQWGVAGKALTLVVTAALNTALFVMAFKVLTDVAVDWKAMVPGAVVGGVGFTLLQFAGGLYVNHVLNGASRMYGTFAVVLGLLSWLYLNAQVAVFAAEVNVVLHRELAPRSLTGEELTDQDRKALRHYAEVEERLPQEDVAVELRDGAAPAEGEDHEDGTHSATAPAPEPAEPYRTPT
jgi:YihY family inner membrane protein